MATTFFACDPAEDDYIDMEVNSYTNFFCHSQSHPQPREFDSCIIIVTIQDLDGGGFSWWERKKEWSIFFYLFILRMNDQILLNHNVHTIYWWFYIKKMIAIAHVYKYVKHYLIFVFKKLLRKVIFVFNLFVLKVNNL